MTSTQNELLKGTVRMYKRSGEMVPVKLFNRSDLDVIVENGGITIVKNPYRINDDFFGLSGKKYPADFTELMKFRKLRDKSGDVEKSLELVKTMEI